jgi:hypothetical protein
MAYENGKNRSVEVQPLATRRTFSAEYKRRAHPSRGGRLPARAGGGTAVTGGGVLLASEEVARGA